MQQANTTEIVDLCSGGTGPWRKLHQQLAGAGCHATITLTDKYPDPASAQRWAATTEAHINYLTESVDATQVPPRLTGMRTLFEGFHHFQPAVARAILADAANQRVAIGVFDVSLKPPFHWILLLLSPLMTLLAYFFITPLLRPRTPARFIWTYLLPIVPLVTCWDGVVSLLRVYSPPELTALTEQIQADDYVWEIGQAATGTPLFVYNYALGYPTDPTL